MTLKTLGAILVLIGCGGFGILIAAAHRREVNALRHLILAIDYMSSQLQYQLTPLPELCSRTADMSKGTVKTFFAALSKQLQCQVSPNVQKCVDAVLSCDLSIPVQTRDVIAQLGDTLGCFDVQGQLQALSGARTQAETVLSSCLHNQDVRLRSYQTLSLCAGAALAILFI